MTMASLGNTVARRLERARARAIWAARLRVYSVNCVPVIAVGVAVVMHANGHTVHPGQYVVMAVLYFLTLCGVEIGFHRFFTHGAFTCPEWFKRTLAVLGTMSFQGGVIWWVATHREHHARADRPGDPHSPYYEGSRELGFLSGLWHAHIGWLLRAKGIEKPNAKAVADLYADPWLFAINRDYFLWGLLGICVSTSIGAVLTGTWLGAVDGFIWGGCVRVLIVNHAMYSLNSLCHRVGAKPFTHTKDMSRNNALVALICLGAGWHNNHHSFPKAAYLNFRWWELDVGGMCIKALVLARIIRNPYMPPPDFVELMRTKARTAQPA